LYTQLKSKDLYYNKLHDVCECGLSLTCKLYVAMCFSCQSTCKLHDQKISWRIAFDDDDDGGDGFNLNAGESDLQR